MRLRGKSLNNRACRGYPHPDHSRSAGGEQPIVIPSPVAKPAASPIEKCTGNQYHVDLCGFNPGRVFHRLPVSPAVGLHRRISPMDGEAPYIWSPGKEQFARPVD